MRSQPTLVDFMKQQNSRWRMFRAHCQQKMARTLDSPKTVYLLTDTLGIVRVVERQLKTPGTVPDRHYSIDSHGTVAPDVAFELFSQALGRVPPAHRQRESHAPPAFRQTHVSTYAHAALSKESTRARRGRTGLRTCDSLIYR